ncbi:MAG: plasmid recombination protein [Oscillospiraceae bacterium]|nr:plasmid recombination protein [Oscillospiraceae bacterium]
MEQFSISFALGKGSAPHGGNIEHNNREFLASNVNEIKSPLNVVFTRTDIEDAYHQLFDDALEKYNEKQNRPCRRIQNYYQHVASGNRESPFYEAIVQFGDSINAPVGSERGKIAKDMLIEFMKGFQERNPNLHVFNATLHLDEASPHLHIDFVPYYTKGRKNGLEKGVSMKAALEEMGFRAQGKMKNQLVLWVQSEKKVMDQILNSHGYTREDKHVKHKHMSVADYKTMVNSQKTMQRIAARLGLSGEEQRSRQELYAKLAASEKKVEQLEAERKSPYACFYYSSPDKQIFVQDVMRQEGIHFRETDNGFEVQECFARRIREIEKTYQAPASTIRDRLRDDIDSFLYQSKSFDEFIQKMKAANYEVKQGKYISVKPPYGQRFTRLKSLGEHYDEFSLKKRMKIKARFEARLDKRIKELEAEKATNLCVLQEVRRYIVVVEKGDLPIRKKDKTQPFSWSNDPEIDKLLALNNMLNQGMTVETIRKKAETLEATAQTKGAELEQAENDLRQYLEMKEKIEIVFEGKASDAFSLEQAKAAVRQYPDINASNYRNIDKVVDPAKVKVQELAEEHRAIRSELKTVTEALSVIEKATNHTYVDHLLADQRRIAASEVLMNGIYSGESL